MSESVNIDRQQGAPLEFHIDLKWSLWSVQAEHFEEYAPETIKHLRAGFAGGFDEHGDTIVVLTAPRKEIRFGKVTIDPKANLVTVEFRSEFDDDSQLHETDEFTLPDTIEEFMTKVDEVEERLIAKSLEPSEGAP